MIAVIVLAAGLSKRMGRENKLTAQVGGKALYQYALDAATRSGIGPVILVHGDTPLACPHDVESVHALRAKDGQSFSLRAGIAAARKRGAAGAMVLLGDMPLLTADILVAIRAHVHSAPSAIWRPHYQGKPGHPVYWPARLFPALERLEGDDGARPVLNGEKGAIRLIDWPDDSVIFDVDTPGTLAAARTRICA